MIFIGVKESLHRTLQSAAVLSTLDWFVVWIIRKRKKGTGAHLKARKEKVSHECDGAIPFSFRKHWRMGKPRNRFVSTIPCSLLQPTSHTPVPIFHLILFFILTQRYNQRLYSVR